MDFREALQRAEDILAISGVQATATPKNFLEYGPLVAYAAKQLSNRDLQAMPWLLDWARTWRGLYDRFDRVVEADPMVLYQPANRAALEFHSSPAFIRYFRAGNRTSKTQSGYAEHYLVTTGQHKWRDFGHPPHATGLLAGLPFNDYMPGVFEAKFLTGEQDNPLSPMFPVGGKWFYHYDERKHMITLGCPQCAEAGKANSCKHRKSTVRLFSPEKGYEALQGQVFTLFHFDEDTPEEFFDEARQRLKTARYPSMILTGTPLHGPEAWEQRKVAAVAERNDPLENRNDPEDPNSVPLVSLHSIDQFEAGLVPHSEIRKEMVLMDEFSVRARIYGEPLPLADKPVFDRAQLKVMKDRDVRDPQRGFLVVAPDEEGRTPDLAEVQPDQKILFNSELNGSLRVWKQPEAGEIYVIGVDTAKGMASPSKQYAGDFSCASVCRLYMEGTRLKLELVAQYHGHLNMLQYADEVMKLAIWYNSALVIVETTGGYGEAVVLKLKNEYAYWNLYRPTTGIANVDMNLASRVGVDTNQASKPFMVVSLQRFVNQGDIIVHDIATISEMLAFTQETSGASGQALVNVRYRGAGGTKDDRVMSLCVLAGVVVSSPTLAFQVQYKTEKDTWSKDATKDMTSVYAQLETERASQEDLV